MDHQSNEDHVRPEMGALVSIIIGAVFVMGCLLGAAVTALLL